MVLLGTALLFPVQGAIDRVRPEPPQVIDTLPPARILPALSIGHRETMADLLEIRTTNFLMKRMTGMGYTDQERNHLWTLYDAILELDPHNADACWRGGVLMATVGGRPDASVALLKRGLGEEYTYKGKVYPARPGVDPGHPNRWRLYHEQAAAHFMQHANRAKTPEEKQAWVRKAGQLWILAGSQEQGPKWLVDLGRKLAKRGLSELEALKLEWDMWKDRGEAGYELEREAARRRALAAHSNYKRALLQKVVDDVKDGGRSITRLSELRGADLSDPLEVGYLLIDGKVISPGFEAAQLLRLLNIRYHGFQTRHGRRPLTIAELEHDEPVPPYLVARISAEGITVVPRRQ